MFSFERIAVLLKQVKGSNILENMLVLYDDVKHNQAVNRWCEVRPTLVVLILTEDKLSLLRIVQALKKEASKEHSNLLTVLE